MQVQDLYGASLARRMLAQAVMGAAVTGLLLFAPAGTLAWPQGWAFLVLFALGGELPGLWLLRHDRALLAERMRSPMAPSQTPRDRALISAMLIAFTGWIVFMALDSRRFGWSSTPAWAQALGALLMVAAFCGWFWVLRVNSFAATTIRVQSERGHAVATTGPYAVVRHPMYAFTVIFMMGAPLLLGSMWGLAGLALFIPLLAARAVGEERVLVRGLAGYADYARQVRFRLLPGFW